MRNGNIIAIDHDANRLSAIARMVTPDFEVSKTAGNLPDAVGLIRTANLDSIAIVLLAHNVSPMATHKDGMDSIIIGRKIIQALADTPERENPLFLLTPADKSISVKQSDGTFAAEAVDLENDKLVVIDFDVTNIDDLAKLPEILDNL